MSTGLGCLWQAESPWGQRRECNGAQQGSKWGGAVGGWMVCGERRGATAQGTARNEMHMHMHVSVQAGRASYRPSARKAIRSAPNAVLRCCHRPQWGNPRAPPLRRQRGGAEERRTGWVLGQHQPAAARSVQPATAVCGRRAGPDAAVLHPAQPTATHLLLLELTAAAGSRQPPGPPCCTWRSLQLSTHPSAHPAAHPAASSPRQQGVVGGQGHQLEVAQHWVVADGVGQGGRIQHRALPVCS